MGHLKLARVPGTDTGRTFVRSSNMPCFWFDMCLEAEDLVDVGHVACNLWICARFNPINTMRWHACHNSQVFIYCIFGPHVRVFGGGSREVFEI